MKFKVKTEWLADGPFGLVFLGYFLLGWPDVRRPVKFVMRVYFNRLLFGFSYAEDSEGGRSYWNLAVMVGPLQLEVARDYWS